MADLAETYRRKSNFWSNWGAVVILAILFFASWAGMFFTKLETVKLDSREHHQQFQMSDYWPQFWNSTFENWQSEWLQLAAQAILISGFSSYVFRKQNEQNYKTQVMIEELQKELKKKSKR